MTRKIVVAKSGKRTRSVQAYRCEAGHFFKEGLASSSFTNSFIEFVVYVYLQSLSLNTTVEIVRATYEDDLLSKGQVLKFLEWVADALPTLDDIDRMYNPVRSGYLAFDGVWFGYGGEQIVLLVCFDPVSFDIVAATFSEGESQEGYKRLMRSVKDKLPKQRFKGIYGDGDTSLISALKVYFPDTPFQLCVVHKHMRMQETIPLKHTRRSRVIGRELKEEVNQYADLFHNTLYAGTEEESLQNLTELLHFTTKHPREKFVKATNQLKTNFGYTLTHFRYQGMMRDNNLIECFNGCIKPRLKLMKSFKKKENLNRYLKLFLSEFRFHTLKESKFTHRRNRSPLQLGQVQLPQYYNFLTLLREQLNLTYQPL